MEPHPENLKPFKKGDPRINRNGRPRSFDALRKLAQQIAAEIVPGKDGQPATIRTLNTDGSEGEHVLTVAEGILRSWATSNKPDLQQAFIEVAFGKVPATIESSGANALPVLRVEVVTEEKHE
jgi:hypothetical protein